MLTFSNATHTGESVTYNYDNRGQLTKADYTTQTDATYTYDDNGNHTNGFTLTTNNRIDQDAFYWYGYDDEGNLLWRVRKSDNADTIYEWDHRNRLVSVTDYDTFNVQTQKVTYSYDAFNRLVKRTFQTTSGSAVTAGYFVHDGEQIVLELESDGDVAHRLLWGPAVDQALADEAVGAGTTYWYFGDHVGTVRDVATYNATTDATTVANHLAFDAFGRRVSETNSALGDFDLGFTGKWFDRATGLQWNINRWYNPGIQRWMSEDPIGFAGGDANLYRYVDNMPNMATDADGLEFTLGPEFHRGKLDGHVLDGKKPGIEKIPTDELKRYNDEVVENAFKKNRNLIEQARKEARPDKVERYQQNIKKQELRRSNINRELQRRSKPKRPPFFLFRQLIKLPWIMVMPPGYGDDDGDGIPNAQDPDFVI